MKYLLGTGAYRISKDWARTWLENGHFEKSMAHSRVAISAGFMDRGDDLGVKALYEDYGYSFITLSGNPGHVGDLLSGAKPHDFCGWSSAILALAMIAYCDESDLAYVEQDALVFGPWLERMYADMGDGDMVFGAKMTKPPYMACSQSLFLIRHRFIPEFVQRYIAMGKDGDPANLPETKFARLEEQLGSERIKRLSFGVDRERPIPFDDEVFFAQKWTQEEIDEAKRRGLL